MITTHELELIQDEFDFIISKGSTEPRLKRAAEIVDHRYEESLRHDLNVSVSKIANYLYKQGANDISLLLNEVLEYIERNDDK